MNVFFQVITFILQLLGEINAVEKALPGAPGADKTAAVLDKVAPVAAVLGAERDHITSIIDGAVGIANSLGVFKKAAPAPAAAAAAGEVSSGA